MDVEFKLLMSTKYLHDKCQGMTGILPDLELPPIPLPLALCPPSE